MFLDRLVLKPIAENCYIYHDGKDCILFDPGSEYDIIKKFLENNNLSVKKILLTHCHFDHVGAVYGIQKDYNSETICCKNDIPLLDNLKEMTVMFNVMNVEKPEIDSFVNDGDIIEFNGVEIKVISTPGHTAGSVCYYIEHDKILVSGDTLFLESIGRTDFPTGSYEAIEKSIKEKLYRLPDDTLVYPGHGFHTTIGHEKMNNPFIRI